MSARLLPGDALEHSLRRGFIDEYQERIVAGWPAGTRVLDLGGHRVAKRGTFDLARFGFRVVCLNLTGDKRPDVRGDANTLPFRDATFDAVVCAEVLEHVGDPRHVIAEVERVLKPGGSFVATVPFLVHIHGDPQDYGRYTDTFWRMVLTHVGFTDLAIERQGGFWSVQWDALREWVRVGRQHAGRRRWRWAVAARVLGRVREAAVAADVRCAPGSRLRQFTTGFGMAARKALP